MKQKVTIRTLRPRLFILILITLAACQPATQPDDVMALAAAHTSQGAYSAAENLYTQRLSQVEEPGPALALADLYIEWKRPALGLAALDTALARGINTTEVVTRHLTLLMLDGQWQAAAGLAQKHLLDASDNNLALQTLITSALQLHKCEEARDTAERIKQMNIEDENAALTTAILTEDPILICESNPDLCSKALGCDDLCYLDIGHYLIEHNTWALASCVLERAVEVDPGNAAAHTWLGESLSRIDQPQSAEKHFMTAVDLDPMNPLGWLLLGGHALRQGEWDTARVALLNAQRLDPENPAPCLTIAELKAAQSLYNEVDTWIKAALERAVNDVDVWKVAARIYLTRNLVQSDMPEWIANNAVSMDPQDAEAHLLLGWAYVLKGDINSAIPEIDRTIELDSTLGQAYYFRGVLMEEMDNLEQAQLAFTRAADLGYFP